MVYSVWKVTVFTEIPMCISNQPFRQECLQKAYILIWELIYVSIPNFAQTPWADKLKQQHEEITIQLLTYNNTLQDVWLK